MISLAMVLLIFYAVIKLSLSALKPPPVLALLIFARASADLRIGTVTALSVLGPLLILSMGDAHGHLFPLLVLHGSVVKSTDRDTIRY